MTTPLHMAAKAGDIGAVASGAAADKVNSRDQVRGWTPLHYAARHNQIGAIQTLLEKGADTTVRDLDGRTPSDLAFFWSALQSWELLKEKTPNQFTTEDSAVFGTAEKVNVFGGNPLKRMSELRPFPHKEVSQVMSRKSTRYFVFSSPYAFLGEPNKEEARFLSYDEVAEFLHLGDPYQAPENRTFQWAFLGCDPTDLIEDYDVDNTDHRLRGRGYAAIDLGAPAAKDAQPSTASQQLLAKQTGSGGHILPLRPFAFHLPARQAAVLGTAAHLMDWHSRNKFCPGCGSKAVSVDSGWKRTCVPVKEGERKCSAHTGIQNFSFPRYDPVAITCVAHPDGERLFLGRNKGWPEKYYSSMAGFMEPGESIFDAARREIKEETGLELQKVVSHSTQPWPFPGSLMCGCVGLAKEGSEMFEPEEDELQDGRWFTRSEVLLALFLSSSQDWGSPVPPHILEKAPFLTGPGYAISSQLAKSWATGEMDQILFGRTIPRPSMEKVLKDAGIWDWVAKVEGLGSKI